MHNGRKQQYIIDIEDVIPHIACPESFDIASTERSRGAQDKLGRKIRNDKAVISMEERLRNRIKPRLASTH